MLKELTSPYLSICNWNTNSGLRESLFQECKRTQEDPGNFKKQVTTADGKVQPEMRSLTGKQIAWMIFDFFKTRSETEAILGSRDPSNVYSRTTTLNPSAQSGTKSVQDASWKVGRIEIVVTSVRARDDNWRQTTRSFQFEIDGPRTSRA